ncbi:MAG: hypothetical protein QXV22_02555 [Thermoplasmataceae archaeon]
MAKIRKLVYGIYPKREELRIKIGRWERKSIGTAELSDIIRRETDIAVDKFRDNGIDLFTDPLFNWYDLFRPLLLSFGGVKIGPLTRLDETNTFYRLPLIDNLGEITHSPAEFAEIEDNPPLPLYHSAGSSNLAFLPGPFTVLNMSKLPLGSERNALLSKLASLYKEIMRMSGYKKAFIFEYNPGSLDSPDIYGRIAEPANIYLYLRGKINAASFKKTRSKFGSIIVSPRENDLNGISRFCETPGIQAVDSHTTRVETEEEVLSVVPETLNEAIVTHIDYMDFLPRAIADQKVELLGRL